MIVSTSRTDHKSPVVRAVTLTSAADLGRFLL